MVVVVDADLAVDQLWWRDPFDAAVGAYSGNPATLFDQAVMGRASEDFLVDVGVAALGPTSLGMVDLAAVAGHRAPGEGAAAVACVQDDALASRGEPFGAPEVERFTHMVGEDHQVMEREACHADDI